MSGDDEAKRKHDEWMAGRDIVKSDDPRWPYLCWRYKQEFGFPVCAKVWAFPFEWTPWANVQIQQRSKPWAKKEESTEHRRRVIQRLRDSGVLPPDDNPIAMAAE